MQCTSGWRKLAHICTKVCVNDSFVILHKLAVLTVADAAVCYARVWSAHPRPRLHNK